MESREMSLERKTKTHDDAEKCRPSTRIDAVYGMMTGSICAIFLAPVLVAGAWLYLLPAHAYRLTVATGDLTPLELVRAELGGWPLTLRRSAQGAIEFHIERTRLQETHLDLEFKIGDRQRTIATRVPVRARGIELFRPATAQCRLAALALEDRLYVTPCMSSTDDF
jgi:hypothetical protein